VADENRGPFPARWSGENAETGLGFALYEEGNLSVVVFKLAVAGYGRSEEREGVADERREMLRAMLR